MVALARVNRTSPKQIQKKFYSDINTSILVSNDSKDLNVLTNEDAVRQSIINILLTNPGERLFNSNFGSSIRGILFENITPQTTTNLITLIKNAIENFEPRARLIDVVAEATPEENAYLITVVFSTINRTEPITLDFILNRVR